MTVIEPSISIYPTASTMLTHATDLIVSPPPRNGSGGGSGGTRTYGGS